MQPIQVARLFRSLKVSAMQYLYSTPLTDEELLKHLGAGDNLVLRVPGLRWQDVERQIERLGFGESFLVAETQSSRGRCCRVEPVLPFDRHSAQQSCTR